MRTVRLLLVPALVAALIGALGGHLLSGSLFEGGLSTSSQSERTDPPTGLGSGGPSPVRVTITPADPAASLLLPPEGNLELVVAVDNPNATPVSGLGVRATVTGGECLWVEGPFPAPFGLSPGGTSARTCRLRPTAPGPVTVGATVLHQTSEVAAASVEVERSAPASTDPAGPAPDRAGPAEAPLGVEAAPAPAVPTPSPTTTPPPCPRLAGGLALPGTPLLDELGPRVRDLARSLDTAACPGWTSLDGLDVVRATDGTGPCPSWLVVLPGEDAPVARLSGPQAAPCPAAPLDLEVVGRPTSEAAMLTTLVAWAVHGDPDHAVVVHAAARSGTGTACDGRAIVAVRSPYEQSGPDGRTTYRSGLTPC